jgi:hypothetical protein
MDALGFTPILELIGNFGLLGLIIFLWWYDQRQTRKIVECHKRDLAKILDRYEGDMSEMREMYKSNVELVRDYKSIAGDLKEIVVMNIRGLTEMKEEIVRL